MMGYFAKLNALRQYERTEIKRNAWQFDDYTTEKGDPALSVRVAVRDMGYYKKPIEPAVRAQASRHASRIENAFRDLIQRRQLERDLVTGARLDPRKRRQVGVALRNGYVDPNALRPYQRKSLTVDMPRLAIIGSAGVYELNEDHDYVRRVTELTMALTWACEAVGMDVDAALMEGVYWGYIDKKQKYRRVQLAFMMVEAGRATPLEQFSLLTDRNVLYEQGFGPVYKADSRVGRIANDVSSAKNSNGYMPWGGSFISMTGGMGVHWAREFLDADLVISIGNLTDAKNADIAIKRDVTVDEAVNQIIQQVRTFKR